MPALKPEFPSFAKPAPPPTPKGSTSGTHGLTPPQRGYGKQGADDPHQRALQVK